MRSTESTNTKTIAFQVDGLSKPLWIKILGGENCSLQHLLSWAKTGRLLKLRDAHVCTDARAPVGTMSQARDFVLTSSENLVDEVMCFISLAFSFAVLPSDLDNSKTRELRNRFGEDCRGIYAGDLTISSLFYPSTDDRDILGTELTGKEILFGCATIGSDRTVLLLLADHDVIVFDNSKPVKKHLDQSQMQSIASLVDKKNAQIEALSQFVRQAYAAFGSRVPSADAYLTATRFVQAFLSMAKQNFTLNVDSFDMSRRTTLALRKDAARLRFILKNSYMGGGMGKFIDLSRKELQAVHYGQASISEEQTSRISHDLGWQDEVYQNATVDIDASDIPWGTLSDDEHRKGTIRRLYLDHQEGIRKKRKMEDNEKNELKLNLAVMCYNRLTKNEHATTGFETVLCKYETTMVVTEKYKAVYTPHSGAAILYFDEEVFEGLRLATYQPIKGKIQSVFGLTAVLHDQIESGVKDVVDKKVYSKLQEGLHNITAVQDVILEAMTTESATNNSSPKDR